MTDKNYKFKYVNLTDTWGESTADSDCGFELSWAAEGIGFGQLTFVKKDGVAKCHTECMSKEFIRAALNHFLDSIELVDI